MNYKIIHVPPRNIYWHQLYEVLLTDLSRRFFHSHRDLVSEISFQISSRPLPATRADSAVALRHAPRSLDPRALLSVYFLYYRISNPFLISIHVDVLLHALLLLLLLLMHTRFSNHSQILHTITARGVSIVTHAYDWIHSCVCTCWLRNGGHRFFNTSCSFVPTGCNSLLRVCCVVKSSNAFCERLRSVKMNNVRKKGILDFHALACQVNYVHKWIDRTFTVQSEVISLPPRLLLNNCLRTTKSDAAGTSCVFSTRRRHLVVGFGNLFHATSINEFAPIFKHLPRDTSEILRCCSFQWIGINVTAMN